MISSRPGSPRLTSPSRFEPLLALAAERGRFEAAVLRRYAGALTREDAEDVVSDALLKSADACPAQDLDAARGWFTRVALNRAEDERRRRYGRPRSGRGPAATGPSSARRFVALHDCAEAHHLAADTAPPEEAVVDRLRRAEVRATVQAALAEMDPMLARVLRERHLAGDGDETPRARAAAAMEVPVWRYERLYTQARKAFMDATAGRL